MKNKKPIKVTSSLLKNLIKEAIVKQQKRNLREDIDVTDSDIDNNYSDDEYMSYSRELGHMPDGYDNDLDPTNWEDQDAIDKMIGMNNQFNSGWVGTPALKNAEQNASWEASEWEDEKQNFNTPDFDEVYYDNVNPNTFDDRYFEDDENVGWEGPRTKYYYDKETQGINSFVEGKTRRTNKKNTVKLSESKLRKMIKESINEILIEKECK